MTFPVMIEIPMGSRVKYEYDKERNLVVVDRILRVKVPYNYGFFPNTLWHDGDPLDAIVFGNFELHPGTLINAHPMAIVKMYDQGISDYKVVCAGQEKDRGDLPLFMPNILSYLETYKPGVEIRGVIRDNEEICNILTQAELAYGFGIERLVVGNDDKPNSDSDMGDD